MRYEDVMIIVPCHNEELSIQQTIIEIKSTLPGCNIVVIDNASIDRTAEIAYTQGCTVITEPRKGKGNAVRKGFEYALKVKPKVLLMVDGDATYSCIEFPQAIQLIQNHNYDMVIGARKSKVVNSDNRQVAFRKMHAPGNYFLSKINKILFGLEILDTLSGWRAFSMGFVNSFSIGESGFEIESELNAHAYSLKSAVANLSVGYFGRLQNSESKLKTYKDGLRILKRQLRMFRQERPLIAYSILGIPWFLLSLYLMQKVFSTYIDTHLVPKFPSLITSVAAFIISVQLWATGMILENVRIARIEQTYFQYKNWNKF